MKHSCFVFIALFIGLCAGTFYGWKTGYTDGMVAGQLPDVEFLKAYGALRATDDLRARDRLAEFQAFDAANIFVAGHSYSPLFYIMHPKADEGLLNIAAYWELNTELPSVWRKGFYPPLFDYDSPDERRLKALKAGNKEQYKRILEEHRKVRADLRRGKTEPSDS